MSIVEPHDQEKRPSKPSKYGTYNLVDALADTRALGRELREMGMRSFEDVEATTRYVRFLLGKYDARRD